KEICDRLEKKGFASTNVVLGVGSYSYQYRTRDSLGFAMKATYAKVKGEERMLFKDPKTDDGTKRSQRGLVIVKKDNEVITCVDGLLRKEYNEMLGEDLLEDVFVDGEIIRNESLSEIREQIKNTL